MARLWVSNRDIRLILLVAAVVLVIVVVVVVIGAQKVVVFRTKLQDTRVSRQTMRPDIATVIYFVPGQVTCPLPVLCKISESGR
jgi:heme/copper-type cytochrome/quinol oxidase subunit 2